MHQELNFTREYLNIISGFQDNVKSIFSIYSDLLNRIPSHVTNSRNNTAHNMRSNREQNLRTTLNPRNYVFTYLPRTNHGNQVLNTRVPFFTREFNVQYDNLQPVVVRPSPIQLLTAVEYTTYSSSEIQQEADPVDQNDFTDGEAIVQIRQCGHCFRPHNFDAWFQSNVRCPMCRFDIRESINSERTTLDSSANNATDSTNTSDHTQDNTTPQSNLNDNEQQLVNSLINYANTLMGDL